MARLALAAFAFLFIAKSALSAPSAPVASSTTPDIQQLARELQTSIDKSLADLKKSLNLPEDPNGEAIVKAIKEQANKAETALNDMRNKLQEQVKSNPQISQVLNTLQQKIEEAQGSLKQKNPELAANAQKLTDQLKGAWDSVTGEIQKVHTEFTKTGGARDDLENLLKNLIDRGSDAAKELQTKVQEAVNSGTKKP